jgi:hypothetical protein
MGILCVSREQPTAHFNVCEKCVTQQITTTKRKSRRREGVMTMGVMMMIGVCWFGLCVCVPTDSSVGRKKDFHTLLLLASSPLRLKMISLCEGISITVMVWY